MSEKQNNIVSSTYSKEGLSIKKTVKRIAKGGHAHKIDFDFKKAAEEVAAKEEAAILKEFSKLIIKPEDKNNANAIVIHIRQLLLNIFTDKKNLTDLTEYLTTIKIDEKPIFTNIDTDLIIDYLTEPMSGGKSKSKKSQKGGERGLSPQTLHILIPMIVIITSLVLYVNNIVNPTICRTVKFRVFGYFYNSTQKDYCRYYYKIYKVFDNIFNDLQAVQTNSSDAQQLISNLTILFISLGKLIAAGYAFIFTYTRFVSSISEFTKNPLGAVGTLATKMTGIPANIMLSFTNKPVNSGNPEEALVQAEAEVNFDNEANDSANEEEQQQGGRRKQRSKTSIKKSRKAYKAKAI